MNAEVIRHKAPEQPVENKVPDATEDILVNAAKEVAKVQSIKVFKTLAPFVNVRANPSDQADILGRVGSGDIIKIDTNNSKGAYAKVVEPFDGYILSKFIAPKKG